MRRMDYCTSLMLVFVFGMIVGQTIMQSGESLSDASSYQNNLYSTPNARDVLDEEWESSADSNTQFSKSTYNKIDFFIRIYRLSHRIESASQEIRKSCNTTISVQEKNSAMQQERAKAITELKGEKTELIAIFGQKFLEGFNQYITFLDSDPILCGKETANEARYVRERRAFLYPFQADIEKQQKIEWASDEKSQLSDRQGVKK